MRLVEIKGWYSNLEISTPYSRGDANRMLDDKSFVQSEKANLLQRIADIYEDEIDDTYDDVGMPTGKVDLGSVEDGSEEVVKQRKNEIDPGILYESDLVHAYVNNVKVFERSAASRRSPDRAVLKKATGMSDEQLEGWSIMFSRNVSIIMYSSFHYHFPNTHSCCSLVNKGFWINMHFMMVSRRS
jgi:hypothetical protein